VDTRCLGAIFIRPAKNGWKFLRFENIGAHGSPVRVWTRA
jgi:hypothetical protein